MPMDSFITTAKAKKLKLVREEIDEAAFDAKALLKDLMDRQPRPTAIVAFQAEATKLLEAATALKIKVPRDLSIVAIRDRSALRQLFPPSFQPSTSTRASWESWRRTY